ncbi:uncharacterized protein ACBT44_013398 [Syngnathus typhle]
MVEMFHVMTTRRSKVAMPVNYPNKQDTEPPRPYTCSLTGFPQATLITLPGTSERDDSENGAPWAAGLSTGTPSEAQHGPKHGKLDLFLHKNEAAPVFTTNARAPVYGKRALSVE